MKSIIQKRIISKQLQLSEQCRITTLNSYAAFILTEYERKREIKKESSLYIIFYIFVSFQKSLRQGNFSLTSRSCHRC